MRVCLLLVMLIAGCQAGSTMGEQPAQMSPPPVAKSAGPKISHVVICWLKTPGDKESRKKLIEVSKSFRQIPGVIDVKCGSVIPSSRPVVDSSYDIAVVITFDGAEALKAYQTHPVHMKATREVLMPLTERILIYDFVEE